MGGADAINDEKRLSLTSKIVIFVLAPSLVTGLFALAPTVLDFVTKPKSSLEYSIVKGPSLASGINYKNIFSIRATNTGKTNLTDVELQFNSINGAIDALNFDKTSLKPKIDTSNSGSSVSIPRMLPSEFFTISIMTTSEKKDTPLEIELRSAETLGIAEKEQATEGSTDFWRIPNIGSAVSAALSVAVMSIFVLLFVRSKVAGSLRSNNRSDIITLIGVLSGTLRIEQTLSLDDNNITYIRLADLLLLKGIMGNQDDVELSTAGLRSLLLVYPIAEHSVVVIRDNLKEMKVLIADDEFDAIRQKAKSLKFAERRQEVIRMFNVAPVV